MLPRWAAFSGGFLHPIESVMLPVLDLDPVLGPAALVRPLAMLRNQALEGERLKQRSLKGWR
jgi:hypothetical protein